MKHQYADPESFVRAGSTLTRLFYLVDEGGGEDPHTTISGPSLARQRNVCPPIWIPTCPVANLDKNDSLQQHNCFTSNCHNHRPTQCIMKKRH